MSVRDNVFAYPLPVWSRFEQRPHGGCLRGADVVRVSAATPAASAVLELTLRAGPTLCVRFRAYGCPYTLAVGEWLAETLERDGVAALARLDAPAIRQALEIPDERAHCALMGEDLVRALRQRLPS